LLVFIRDADDASDDVDDTFKDAKNVLEDTIDDGVADQDDVPVEAPVATVPNEAHLRQSKRVAAQLGHGLSVEVAPDPNATSGPRHV
jgi:hypothetical protein